MKTINIVMECQYCKKVINNRGSLVYHEMCCQNNPNKIIRTGGGKKGCVTWNKGLTKDLDSRVKTSAETYHNNYNEGKYKKPLGIGSTEQREIERRNKISDSINMRYKNGWLPKAGRCKKIRYVSVIAGNILLDGSWELLVAKYLDELKVNWIRNKNRFQYINLNGKESFYTPDFFIKDWNMYIEVKGYETDLDRCKWSQFPYKLEVWKKEKIQEIKQCTRTAAV